MNIVAYHGSDHKFNEFSLNYVGTESGTSGAGYGIYFSTSKADAFTYGKYCYECFLQLQNSVSNVKIDFSFDIVKLLIEKCKEVLDSDLYENYGYENPTEEQKNYIIRSFIDVCDTDTEIIGSIINSLFGNKCDEFLKLLSDYGYTHTLDEREIDINTITHYIVYNLGSIKINKIETIEDL